MKLLGPFNSGAAAGSSGSATANATTTTRVSGKIEGIYVKYNDSPPAATCDVTIATQGTSPAPPATTILALTDAATDGWFYPRANIHSTAGASQASVWDAISVDDKIVVTIAQANAADNVDVWILFSEG